MRGGGSGESAAPGPRPAPALGGPRSRRPLYPPLTSASLAGLRGRGFLRGSARPAASSAASSTTPRRSPAWPGSRGIVSLPALLRAEPPRLPSRSRASVRAGPRLLQGRERAGRWGRGAGAGGGGDRRSRGRAGLGSRAALGSAPGMSPPFPEGRLLDAPGQSRLLLIWPPPRPLSPPLVPSQPRANSCSGDVATGRHGALRLRTATPAGRPPRGRADGAGTHGLPGPRERETRRSPA